jgi:hypothetical protein
MKQEEDISSTTAKQSHQVSVFSEVAQFRGLDDAGLCLDFLFMGKGDRRLGSAEGLRRRLEAREPVPQAPPTTSQHFLN